MCECTQSSWKCFGKLIKQRLIWASAAVEKLGEVLDEPRRLPGDTHIRRCLISFPKRYPEDCVHSWSHLELTCAHSTELCSHSCALEHTENTTFPYGFSMISM